jgi:hypothetical protein
MRTLLLAAAVPAFLMTSAFACDYGKQAQTQSQISVAACQGNGCFVPDEPADPTLPPASNTRDERVPGDATQACNGSGCAKPQPRPQLTACVGNGC